MTDRELMQDALDAMLAAIEAGDWHVDGACDPDLVIRRLQARLAQLEQESVAWEPHISRLYDPNGVLISEKIKRTPDGEWEDI